MKVKQQNSATFIGRIPTAMSGLSVLCDQLDESTEAIITTVEEILKCQVQLDDSMKQGFLCLSKARYNIGLNRISTLQYNEDSLEQASSKVKVTMMGEFLEFELDKDDPGNASEVKSDGLRQRKVKNDDVSDVTNRVEDLKVDEKVTDDAKKGDVKTSSLQNSDPLRWFGVLVPQALRQSQGYFKKATELSCQLATLKASLIKRRRKHSSLMVQKRELVPTKEKSDTDDKLSDTDSSESC